MNYAFSPIQPRDRELHRRNAVLLFVLGFCSFACCVILLGRRIRTGEGDYRFLVWNLFLAWAPLIFATLAHWIYSARHIPGRRIWLISLLTLWLLFFPNAPYLLSDLKHLAQYRTEAPIWFDAILVGSFVLTGVIAGFASLTLIHDLARRRFGSFAAWTLVTLASLASGFAIYLGRFIRLNSWDLITRPGESFRIIADQVVSGHHLPRTIATSVLYAAFIVLGYLAIWALARVTAIAANPVDAETP
jgi:uncharacterized membrane protein